MLAFRYRKGSFLPKVREYRTGGRGIHDLSNSGALDAEQQIVTSEDRKLLFAVNAGSDTVAVFHIRRDGTLRKVGGSPFKSRGTTPASVGVSGDLLFVANKAHDPHRDVESVPASYATYRIGADGALTPLGEPVEVPAGSSPTQVFVPPHGQLLVGTEESGPWRAFRVGDGGSLTQGPNSPLELDDRVFAPGERQPMSWPQGLTAHPTERLIYAGVANARRLVVYSYADDGTLEYVSSQFTNGAELPCWVEINKTGTRLYTGNAGSQNISVYDIAADPRNPRLIQQVKLRGKGNPWSFELDPSGRYLFMVNMRAVRQIPAGKGNTLHSFRVGTDGKLKELRSSPVKIPVPVGTNPWGIAVVPRRR